MARKLIRNPPPPFKRDLQKMSISVDLMIFFWGGGRVESHVVSGEKSLCG